MKRIEAHYKMFREFYLLDSLESQKILDKYKKCDWFVLDEKICIYFNDEQDNRKYRIIDAIEIESIKIKDIETGTFIDRPTALKNIILYTDTNEPYKILCEWYYYGVNDNGELDITKTIFKSIKIIEDHSDREIVF